MNVVIRTTSCIALLFLMGGAVPAAAQQTAQPAVTLQATGSFANNGSFAGTLTINRFEQRSGQIVAIGIVQGTLSRANRVIGTALATEVTWPVRVSAGGQLASATSAAGPQIIHVRWPAGDAVSVSRGSSPGAGCTPLQVNLGAANVNLLGLQVALDPVGLTLSGTAGSPLGDLVCAASDLLGNVADLRRRQPGC